MDIGPVQEPSILRDPFFVGTFLALLLPMLWCAWKIYTSSWIGSPWIWTTFVLAVFMFATSGTRRHRFLASVHNSCGSCQPSQLCIGCGPQPAVHA